MRNAISRILTISLLLLLGSCGIKWATNKVLTNRAAIEKVGSVYDALTPKDTTERIVFITGDSIELVKTDTVYSFPNSGFIFRKIDNEIFRLHPDSTFTFNDSIYRKLKLPKDTIRITKMQTIRRTDTIIRTLPPDNRKIARLSDSLALYRSLAANYAGNSAATTKQLKTAETRLIWMAGVLLLAGVVIGVLVRFKLKI